MFKQRFILLGGIAVAALLGVRSFHNTPAQAAFAGADLSSTGPLSHIYISQGLRCQVAHVDDAEFAFSPTNEQEAGCGTFLRIGSALYGLDTEYTFVSQTGITGVGSSSDPLQVVTVVDAGASGIRVTETDSYVLGDEFYRTSVLLQNLGSTSVTARVYRGADCFLGGTGEGYGFVDSASGSIGCSSNPNNSPSGRIEEWTPITPNDHFLIENGMAVGQLLFSGAELPDTCLCDVSTDNAAVIDWHRTIGPGESTIVAHFTTISPTGVGAPTPTPVPQTATPVRVKTHTPTATSTPAPTNTPMPATPTGTTTQRAIDAPPRSEAVGPITAPNTGSGPTNGSPGGLTMLIVLLLAAGTCVVIGGCWVRLRI